LTSLRCGNCVPVRSQRMACQLRSSGLWMHSTAISRTRPLLDSKVGCMLLRWAGGFKVAAYGGVS